MNEDPELQKYDDSSIDRSYAKRRGVRMDGKKRLPILGGIALILIFVVGIIYFFTKRPTATDTKGEETLTSKMAAIEQKVTSLEAQITQLQGKSTKRAIDPIFF